MAEIMRIMKTQHTHAMFSINGLLEREKKKRNFSLPREYLVETLDQVRACVWPLSVCLEAHRCRSK